MTDKNVEPQVLEEPGSQDANGDGSTWTRGLWMLLFAVFFEVAKTVLAVATLIQFFWLLFAKEKNPHIAGFGNALSDWFSRVVVFQTGASDDKPFPFAKWGPKAD